MRILVIAMANSIHTARWLKQFDHDKDMEMVLMPSTVGGIKTDLKNWTKLFTLLTRFNISPRMAVVLSPWSKLNTAIHRVSDRFLKSSWRTRWLVKTIKRMKPDIIHSLEFQHAGYTCLEAKKIMGDNFPVWIATNWGSDIYLFSQLKEHKQRITEILQLADFYSAECQRDYALADGMGMAAHPLPVIPNSGGIHLEEIEALRKTPTSQRKLILVKGYQMVFGRALSALRAIELVADELKAARYKICFFSVTSDIEIAIEIVANRTGLDIEVIPIENYLSHQQVLELHAKARCYIGISISDGISTSMLEAMALGAFPIQTCTSCANEWIEDGVSGLIAPCEDETTLGEMILRAVNDDNLVDRAAEINWKTMQNKASYDGVKKIARSFYDTAYAAKSPRR